MSDLISRQAAIDALYDWSEHSMTDAEAWHIRQVIGDIKSMPPAQSEPQWIPVSERLPNHDEYIKNNGLFNVTDGNRSYSGWFDIYDTQRFGEPTIYGFHVNHAVTAWMPLPKPYVEGAEE